LILSLTVSITPPQAVSDGLEFIVITLTTSIDERSAGITFKIIVVGSECTPTGSTVWWKHAGVYTGTSCASHESTLRARAIDRSEG